MGEETTTDSVRNLVVSEVNRNKRAPQWGVATIEVADEETTTDSVRNFVVSEVNRNKRAPRWGVATIEVAEKKADYQTKELKL